MIQVRSTNTTSARGQDAVRFSRRPMRREKMVSGLSLLFITANLNAKSAHVGMRY